MKKAHRDRDQSVRGHSTLTKVEQLCPVVAARIVRSESRDGKIVCPSDFVEWSAGVSWLR